MRYSFPSGFGSFSHCFCHAKFFREVDRVAFSLIFKALVVIIETGFELSITAFEVMLDVVLRYLCCFVHNAVFATLFFQSTAGFDPVVARWYGVVEVGFTFLHGRH